MTGPGSVLLLQHYNVQRPLRTHTVESVCGVVRPIFRRFVSFACKTSSAKQSSRTKFLNTTISAFRLVINGV